MFSMDFVVLPHFIKGGILLADSNNHTANQFNFFFSVHPHPFHEISHQGQEIPDCLGLHDILRYLHIVGNLGEVQDLRSPLQLQFEAGEESCAAEAPQENSHFVQRYSFLFEFVDAIDNPSHLTYFRIKFSHFRSL